MLNNFYDDGLIFDLPTKRKTPITVHLEIACIVIEYNHYEIKIFQDGSVTYKVNHKAGNLNYKLHLKEFNYMLDTYLKSLPSIGKMARVS